MLARGRIVVGRNAAGVMVRRRVARMHLVVYLHAVMPVLSDDCHRRRSLTFRAQHGRRHRTPDGQQHGHQNQDEDAEVFHVGRLSSRRSVCAERQKFQMYRPVPYPRTRCLPRGVARLGAAAFDTATSPARPSRMGHSGRSSP